MSVQALALLAVLSASNAAAQEVSVTPCGEFLPALDIQGDVIGSIPGTSGNQACLDACFAFPGCNAAIRINANGGCFFKSVDAATVATDPFKIGTSFLVCPGEETGVVSGGDGTGGGEVETGVVDGGGASATPCGVFIPGVDVQGDVIGSVPGSSDNQACLDACLAFAGGCNAAIRIDADGGCFFKSVNAFAVATDPFVIGIASQGAFGPLFKLPLVPVASVALPNGEVLVWSGDAVDTFNPIDKVSGKTFYTTYNTQTGFVAPLKVANLNHDMFCPGIAIQPNGDIAVVGGSAHGDGAASTSVWDGQAWGKRLTLNIARGYNTAVTLPSGLIFTLGGSYSGETMLDKGGEVWEGGNGPWRQTTGITGAAIESDDMEGPFRIDNYPFLFPWLDNSLFHAGPSIGMNWITGLDGDGFIFSAGERGPTAMNGNAVMYEAGKILVVGGAASYSLGDNARASAEVIELGEVGVNPMVRSNDLSPNFLRTYSMSVVLPTGEVALFGGSQVSVEFSDASAVFATEIFDPITETWSVDADVGIPRTYHSSAVLVPDGRVFVGGGGYCGPCDINHNDAQMYSPKYLFNADGSPAIRPNITLSANTVAPGGSITITGSEALSIVSMVRFGSSTHSMNTDQRRLELCGHSQSSQGCDGTIILASIPSLGIAIPGPWMVFAANAAGVMSEAAILNIN